MKGDDHKDVKMNVGFVKRVERCLQLQAASKEEWKNGVERRARSEDWEGKAAERKERSSETRERLEREENVESCFFRSLLHSFTSFVPSSKLTRCAENISPSSTSTQEQEKRREFSRREQFLSRSELSLFPKNFTSLSSKYPLIFLLKQSISH